MRRALAVGLLLLGACEFTSFKYEEPSPYPVEPLPELPERLFRQPADFSIRDFSDNKEYFYYFYEDEFVKQELVTVLDHRLPDPGRNPRPALPEEHQRAMELLRSEWHDAGDGSEVLYAEKVPQAQLILGVDRNKYFYFRKRVEEGRERRDSMLDEKIRYKEAALRQLRDERLNLEADLLAREDAKVFNEPDQVDFLKHQIDLRDYHIAVTEAQLNILRYARYVRDQAYAK